LEEGCGGGNTATRRSGMKARSVRAGTCSGKRRPFWLFRGRSRLVDHSSRLLRGPLGQRGWSADWNDPSKCIKLQLSSPGEDGGGVVLKTCDREVSCEPRQVCATAHGCLSSQLNTRLPAVAPSFCDHDLFSSAELPGMSYQPRKARDGRGLEDPPSHVCSSSMG